MVRLLAFVVPLLLLVSPDVGRTDMDGAPPSAAAIDEAIERGVTYLLEEQRAPGTWASRRRAFGHTALVLFTLQHAGVDAAEDPRVARSHAWFDRHGPGRRDASEPDAATYDTALAILFLAGRGRDEDRRRVERLVRILEAAQAENGQWDYTGTKKGRRSPAGDNSNTQFAVLALGTAGAEGVAVERPCLERALAWWALAAQPDGGFGYASGGSRASASIGSMTAAGIASLGILEAALEGRVSARAGRQRQAAIQRLAQGFEVDHNFGPTPGGARQRQRNAGRGWKHYYLWSVERAMVLAGQERLGTTDWYTEGARHLLDTQKRDGSWRGEHPLYATCFALLFLTRAADPPRAFTPRPPPTGPTTPGAQPDPAPPPPAGSAAPVDGGVDDWLTEGVPPDVLRGRCLARGPSSLPPLVRALSARRPEVRQRAHEALLLLLGDERVGRADRHPLARGRLALYVRRNARHLEAVDGRFVERP